MPTDFEAATVFLAISVAAGAKKEVVTPAASGELARWSFLVGKWDMDSKRYSLDGPVIEENEGRAEFWLALAGMRIQEQQSTTMAGRPMEVLNVFVFHPEKKEWEIARTDSLHHSFNVILGTGSEDTIVLFERNPRPGSDVTRRVTYVRQGDDEFSRLLEFSLDEGKSWLRRNETVYTRRR